MKIGIIGSGGVGGYFGGKLANVGYEVTFLARGVHLEALKENGLSVKSILGDFHIDKVLVEEKIEAMGKVDLVILGVKAGQVKEVASQLNSILHQDSLVLPLQNGVTAVEDLKNAIDSRNIIGGVCRILSKIESPGVIHHFGVNPSIVFGQLDKTTTERVHQLEPIFKKAEIDCRISENINKEIWKKFAFICIGGLMAVLKTPLGDIREVPESRKRMKGLLEEIVALAQHMEIELGEEFVPKTLAFIDSLPFETTFSFARDIWEGKPSELDHQTGAVIRLGQKYGIETPINLSIYRYLEPYEQKARQ